MVPILVILKCLGHCPTLNLNLYLITPGLVTSNMIKQLSPLVAIYTVFARYTTSEGQFVGLFDIRQADISYNLFFQQESTLIEESNYPVIQRSFCPFQPFAIWRGPQPTIFKHFYFQQTRAYPINYLFTLYQQTVSVPKSFTNKILSSSANIVQCGCELACLSGFTLLPSCITKHASLVGKQAQSLYTIKEPDEQFVATIKDDDELSDMWHGSFPYVGSDFMISQVFESIIVKRPPLNYSTIYKQEFRTTTQEGLVSGVLILRAVMSLVTRSQSEG